ncbi:MAG: hypothetical protein IKG79_01495 [Neisseriaceae bacterium]|nr:hypothetical protein [Neisseriaceae bacterium]
MQNLSQNYQVLAITHLAQVAAHANQHWQVSKTDKNGKIISHIRHLTDDERIEETARMIGGEKITSSTRQNAAEMLAAAREKSFQAA